MTSDALYGRKLKLNDIVACPFLGLVDGVVLAISDGAADEWCITVRWPSINTTSKHTRRSLKIMYDIPW